jgi:outer membrane protein assembly factor BamD
MYPRGEMAEEAAFMSAFCNYLQSPRTTLDQSTTYIALSELQLFIDMYPKSDKVAEANRLMDDLRAKLERKSYDISILYYKMSDYQAAIASFENLLDEFPDTEYKEEALYYITMSYYEYAEKSIFSKQTERYEKTIEAYNNLRYLYPESVYLKPAGQAEENARERLIN